MIDVSEELKDAFLSHTQKDIQLSFTDTSYNLTGNDLKLEEATLEQSICDETILTFGKCSSSCFTFTMKNNNKSYKNLEFDVTLTAYDFEGNSYPLSLGHYIVYEDTVSDDRNYRSIVAYDKLNAVMQTDYKDWYHSLTFPMSLKAFRDAFFLHIGINQESKVLINDDFIVKDTINADVLTGQTIIEAICELNCAFGNIGYDGNFRYVAFVQDAGLYPRNDLYPSNELYPDDPNVSLSVTDANYLLGTFVYQDYICQKIDSVRIMEDEDDDGTVVGTGDNQYTISGNFLLFGSDNTQRQTIGERFLEFCEDFFYTPTKIEMWGQPWLEVGDLVQVIGRTTALVFPILHRTLSGITALKDSYEAQGSETYEKASNTLSSQFEKYRSKTMKMERTVDEFYQEYKEFEADTDGTLESHSSLIQQNADNITLEVARAKEAEGGLSSRIQLTADEISAEVRRATGAESTLSSRISQSAHTIDLSVSGTAGQGTSAGITISLYDEDGNLLDSGSGNITLDGNVIFKSNLTDGQTIISGNNIKTGVISSSNGNMTIDLLNEIITATKLAITSSDADGNYFKLTSGGKLTATKGTFNNATVIGNITANSLYLKSATISIDDTYDNTKHTFIEISSPAYGDRYIRFNNVRGTQYMYFGYNPEGDGEWVRFYKTVYCSSSLRADKLEVDSVCMNGRTFGLRNYGDYTDSEGNIKSDYMYIRSANNAPPNQPYWYRCEIQMGRDGNNSLVFRPGRLLASESASDPGNNTDIIYLGTGSRRWKAVYAKDYYGDSTAIQTSDKTAKKDILELDINKSSEFIYSLKPCEYKMKNGDSGRTHHGFIAQEVKESMGDDDWGLYVDQSLDEKSESNLKGLRYGELIADMVATIQSQNERIKTLEERLEKIESLLQKEV